MRNLRKRNLRDGATAVEAAFVIPIILVFIFGGVEIVRLNVIRHTARNAAYEGTRNAIVPGGSADDALVSANEVLSICGIKGADVTVEPANITESTTEVTTRVAVPMATNSWGVGLFARNAILEFETTLRTERSPALQAAAIDDSTDAFEEAEEAADLLVATTNEGATNDGTPTPADESPSSENELVPANGLEAANGPASPAEADPNNGSSAGNDTTVNSGSSSGGGSAPEEPAEPQSSPADETETQPSEPPEPPPVLL